MGSLGVKNDLRKHIILLSVSRYRVEPASNKAYVREQVCVV